MKTYREILELFKVNGDIYAPVIYHNGRIEWFKLDKAQLVGWLSGCNKAYLDGPYPCRVEVEQDGEVFLHPKIENK